MDDIKPLASLWQSAQLPYLELEKHLTEFQVVLTEAGEIVGAIGLQVVGKDARLHSEAYLHPEQEDDLRPKLWERMVNVGKNHDLQFILKPARIPASAGMTV